MAEKNDLGERENKWVIEFLNRPDMSYTTPGRKGNVSLGAFQKVKRFAQNTIVDNKGGIEYFQWIDAVGNEFKG